LSIFVSPVVVRTFQFFLVVLPLSIGKSLVLVKNFSLRVVMTLLL